MANTISSMPAIFVIVVEKLAEILWRNCMYMLTPGDMVIIIIFLQFFKIVGAHCLIAAVAHIGC